MNHPIKRIAAALERAFPQFAADHAGHRLLNGVR